MQTRPKSGYRILVVALAACAVASTIAGRNFAQDPKPAETSISDPLFRVTSKTTRMKIIERFAKIVELKDRIARVDGFDPEILDVSGIQMHPNRVRVRALATGVTTIVLVDENDVVHTVEVFVAGDVRHLQAFLDNMFPNDSIKAEQVGDAVVLQGWVSRPEHITRIVDISERFYPQVLNHMEVGGAQQVQLKIRVMEVQRSKIRKLGFNFLHIDGNSYLASTPGQLTPLAGLVAPFGGPPGVALNPQRFVDSTLAAGVVSNSNIFQGFLEALKQESLLKVLAEPKLMVENGRPAQLLAGGEFPILVPQSLGTVTIEWREFGVRLEAVAHILGRGRVRLELQPEVSSRDFTNAVTVNGLTVPGLTPRRVNTQVTMNFGETYILAGLILRAHTAETSKIPFLGELPWIGAAFRRVSYDEGETELVIMVTPELTGPLKPDELPPGGPGMFTSTPNTRELFRDGMLEVPRYGDDCIGCETSTFFPGGSIVPTPEGTIIPSAPPGGRLTRDPFLPNPSANMNRAGTRSNRLSSRRHPFANSTAKYGLHDSNRSLTSSRANALTPGSIQNVSRFESSARASRSINSPSAASRQRLNTTRRTGRPKRGLIRPKPGLIRP